MSEPLGVLLAGGGSRRMGTDKMLVELDGRPLLHYPLAALEAVVDDVVVVCKEHTPLPELAGRAAIWCEADEPQHPLVGVMAALRGGQGRPALVVAGDMPLVGPDALRAILAAAGAGAVLARAGGRLQPLLGLYPFAALAVLEAMGPGEPATAVAGRLEPQIVELDEQTCLSVNVPEDLLHASALLASRR